MKHFSFFIVFVAFSLLIMPPDATSTRIPSDYYCYKSKSCERGTTTVLGTWQWDIDTNQLATSRTADLWWSHTNRNERAVIPVNGAYIKRIAQGGCYKYGPYEIMEKVNSFTPYIIEISSDITLRQDRIIFNDKPVYELNDLINGGFSKEPVNEMKPLSVFKEGAVFAVITNKGQLARLCVQGFYSNQYYNFKEAELLDKPTQIPGKGSGIHYYHMMLDWTIFRGFDLMPYMEVPE